MMNEDNLEKYISENRDKFDDQFPSPDLWNKIDKKTNKSKLISFSYFQIAAAASIIVLLSVGIPYLINKSYKTTTFANTNELQLGEINKDLNVAEAYYTSQIQQRSSELFQYAKDYPEITSEIFQEFQKLDSSYISLQKDLNENIANEMVIQAMVEHYRIKLKLMEDILSQLKQNKKNQSSSTKKVSYEI
ncbi:MAG: hypothetical protein WCK02_09685 [Bacteroidota bacterium]